VQGAIGVIVSRKLATLNELQTVYGPQDEYDLCEIIMVDNENERRMARTENG
jgi:hypothetical protein